MAALYRNPPLIEALCEFQFEPGSNWDSTIPGLVYAAVRKLFPIRQEQSTFQISMGTSQPVPTRPPNMTRTQFLREDKTALIQIGANFLSVNHLRPYPNWETFRDLIFANLNIYSEIAQPLKVVQIGLRYVNKIEIPDSSSDEKFNIADYLLTFPGIPHPLLQNPIRNFIQRVEIQNTSAQGVLVLQSGSLQPEGEGNTPFLLDLAFVSAKAEPFPIEEVREWIDRAHAEIEIAFESSIGDRARANFGELKND